MIKKFAAATIAAGGIVSIIILFSMFFCQTSDK
jgi:hypothetical protein